MKRTVIPKLLALLAIALGFAYLETSLAWMVGGIIAFATFGALTLPVLLPRSNFYIRTLSRGKGAAGQGMALTFDDGPDPLFTPRILDLLDEAGIQATFFVVGERAKRFPELIREIHARGHLIGNHSQRHGLYFHFLGPRGYERELNAFDRTIESIIGLRCRFFRAPQGLRAPMLADALRRRDVRCVAWSARGYDAVRRDPERIWRSLKRGLKPGAVILLHDGGGLAGSEDREPTLAVLPRLLQEAQRMGLGFARLDSLLGEHPYGTIEG